MVPDYRHFFKLPIVSYFTILDTTPEPIATTTQIATPKSGKNIYDISSKGKDIISLYVFEITIFLMLACVDEFYQCQDNADLCDVSPQIRKDCPKTCGDCKMPG